MTNIPRQSPKQYGFTLRQCSGSTPNLDAIRVVAHRLNREPYITDDSGFDCDILAGASDNSGSQVAYVEARGRKGRNGVDITIKIHYVDRQGKSHSADIESYNPFFGCNVRFFEWLGEDAFLIYREKHHTYAVRFGSTWPPAFARIGDRWKIEDGVLAFMDRNDQEVSCLTVPDLQALGTLSTAEAEARNLLPAKLQGFLEPDGFDAAE